MVVLLFLIVFSISYGHSLTTAVEYSEAVVVKINYSDGTPFSYEKYEIYSPEVLDIDNTLVPQKSKFPDKMTIEWLEKVKKEGIDEDKTGFLIKVLSGIILIFLIYSVFYLTVRRRKVGKED